MNVFLNLFLLIIKLIVLPVIILLFLINLLVRFLLSLAKGLVITVCILVIAVLGALMYFGFMNWDAAWQYLFYPITGVAVIFCAYLFPALINGIIKQLAAFMKYWVVEDKRGR